MYKPNEDSMAINYSILRQGNKKLCIVIVNDVVSSGIKGFRDNFVKYSHSFI